MIAGSVCHCKYNGVWLLSTLKTFCFCSEDPEGLGFGPDVLCYILLNLNKCSDELVSL